MTPFEAMQAAVDIVNNSEHNKNKIASCLFNDTHHIASTNARPQALCDHFTPDIKIGGSSQFIHSEVACIFNADFATDGASLCITDPMCPNCAKAICEAGISTVYIDHKGLDKDFAMRRGDDFQSLSLLMMEKAGINVNIIYRKESRIEPLTKQAIVTRKPSPQSIEFFDWDDDKTIKDYLKMFRDRQAHTAWAIAKIREGDLNVGIIIFEDLTRGLTPQDYADKQDMSRKYRLPVDPLNRLLFFTKRKNIHLIDNAIACNLHPSSRAFVNAIGYGVQSIDIGEMKPDHDDLGHIAAELIQNNGILDIYYL